MLILAIPKAKMEITKKEPIMKRGRYFNLIFEKIKKILKKYANKTKKGKIQTEPSVVTSKNHLCEIFEILP
jgi:hypothetical protein